MGEGSYHGAVANVLDCAIVIGEFEFLSRYYAHFLTNTIGKDINPFIPSAMAGIVPQPLFYKVGFGIKWSTNVDMPLNKETKPILMIFKQV